MSPEPHACSWPQLVSGAAPQLRPEALPLGSFRQLSLPPTDGGPSGQTGSCCAPAHASIWDVTDCRLEAGGRGAPSCTLTLSRFVLTGTPRPLPIPEPPEPASCTEGLSPGRAHSGWCGPAGRGRPWAGVAAEPRFRTGCRGQLWGAHAGAHLLPLGVWGSESVASSFGPERQTGSSGR